MIYRSDAHRRRNAQVFGQNGAEVKGLVPDRIPGGLQLVRELLGLVPVADLQVRVQEAVVVRSGQIRTNVHVDAHLSTGHTSVK